MQGNETQWKGLVMQGPETHRNKNKEEIMFTFDDYWTALDGAGPKLKELILDRAAQDRKIDFWELKELVDKAYSDQC